LSLLYLSPNRDGRKVLESASSMSVNSSPRHPP
jgi:hypothetical protein